MGILNCLLSLLFLLSVIALRRANFTNLIKCPPHCAGIHCIKNKVLKSSCDHGTVFDSCKCCQVCAKGLGDLCGGNEDIYGKCGPGLHCVYAKKIVTMSIGKIGYCRAIPSNPPQHHFTVRMKNSVDVQCKPRCTPDFCSRWPDAICSAIDNVVITRSCQQPCQHTTCNACYFKTKRNPPCPSCGHDEFDCMRAFSKCVKKDTCSRHKYPCESHQKRKSDGRFVCKVPACVTD